jgi:hypothetical protein
VLGVRLGFWPSDLAQKPSALGKTATSAKIFKLLRLT